jgi:sugar phosphate isomerase/epimerase
MSTSRRDFLKSGALAVTGLTFMPQYLFAEKFKKEKILGLQLYTVRDDMHKDPAETLKQLSAIGYQYVEHAGYANRKFYGYAAKEFRKLLDSLNLKMISGHVSFGLKDWDLAKKDFTDEWKYTVDDALVAGQKFIINPWMDESVRKEQDTLMKLLELFNRCGTYCKKRGLQFGYHNHDFEFNTFFNKKRLYDIILANTNPSLVAQQLDIGNMYGVGGRAMQVLKQYPGRFRLMHVKDEIKIGGNGEMGDGYESTILGKGLLPVKEIIDTAFKSGGTQYFIIEQESYQGKTPVDCSKEDFIQMKKWGF